MSLLLERRAGDRAEADAELLADDLRERRLAEARGAGEQHVVEGLAPRLCRVERDRSCSLTRSCPTKSSSRRGRSERSTSSSSGRSAGARNWLVSVTPPAQRQPDALLGGQLGIDLRERPLGVDDRVAELHERVARDEVAGRVGDGGERKLDVAELLLELEHDALRGLLPDPGDRLEARVVAERDRPAQLGGRRAGDDGERDLRADPAHREEMHEELALLGVGEAVELQGVLPDVEVRLDGHLRAGGWRGAGRPGSPPRGSRRRSRRARARPRSCPPACPGAARSPLRPHDASRASGGIEAWQIATARASASCEVGGSMSSASSIFTIRATCPLSARP